MIIPKRLSALHIGAILALFLCASPLPAQEAATSELKASGARIQADKIEQNGDVVSAWGRVRVFYKDLILLAGHVDLNTKTKDALAEGQVSLRLPNEVITAGTMMVNLDTALGSMQGAFGLLQPSLYFSTERLERESEEVYRMGRSRFTACSQAVPRWSVSSARAFMKKDEFIEMWGVTFSVKKVPVFYLPYMKYPLAQERATGFLFPQIGFSGVKGFSLSQSFYWAIARNQDATFSLDYYGAKGVGGGLEYRYMFGSPDKSGAAGLFGGEARLYYFAFRAEEDGSKRDNAYLVRWNHNQTLPGGFALTAAVNYQTSFDFLREFDNNFKRALIFNSSSQVYLTRTWGGLSFSARASQFETNFQGFNNAVISRSLPQISLNLARTKILGPLGFSMSAMYNNWQYGWQSQFDTGTPLKNETITFFPSLSVPWTSIPWLTVNASLSGNIQYFFRSKDPTTNAIVDVPYLAAIYSLEFSLVGPVFYRIHNFGKPAPGKTVQPRLKHLIEPSLTYHYEPPWASPDRIVSTRHYLQNHTLTYGLTNRLFYKATGPAAEVLTWGIQQTFYVTPYENKPNQYILYNWLPAGVSLRFSEITSYLRFYPGTKLSVDYAMGYNTYKSMFSQNRLGLNYGLPTDDFFFRLNWYLSVNPWYTEAFYNRHQVSAAVGLKLPSLNLEAVGEIDYNVAQKKLFYLAGSLLYHYQCMDFRVETRMFYFRDVPEFQFRFSFDLVGVGKSTDFLGGSRLD